MPARATMTPSAHDVEKAVSRTLRETLNALQRTAEELNQALSDLVAACGSTRATNALPPILRAQTAAASLAASLEVLSRFVASSATGPAARKARNGRGPVPGSGTCTQRFCYPLCRPPDRLPSCANAWPGSRI